jgi:hypothetical protein
VSKLRDADYKLPDDQIEDPHSLSIERDIPILSDLDDEPKIIQARAAAGLPATKSDREILADTTGKPFAVVSVCIEHGVAECWQCRKQRRYEKDAAAEKRHQEILDQAQAENDALEAEKHRLEALEPKVEEVKPEDEIRNKWILEKDRDDPNVASSRPIDLDRFAKGQGLRKTFHLTVRAVADFTRRDDFARVPGISGLSDQDIELYRACASDNLSLEEMIARFGHAAGREEHIQQIEDLIMKHAFRVKLLLLPENFSRRYDSRDDEVERKQDKEVWRTGGGSIGGGFHTGKTTKYGRQRGLTSFDTRPPKTLPNDRDVSEPSDGGMPDHDDYDN